MIFSTNLATPSKKVYMKRKQLTWIGLLALFVIALVIFSTIIFLNRNSIQENNQAVGEPMGKPDPVFDNYIQRSLAVLYINPDSARKIVTGALEQKLPVNQAQIIRANNLIGASYHLQANSLRALDYFYKGLEIALKYDDKKQIGNIYNNMGNVYLKTGNYKEALEHYLKSLQIYNLLSEDRNIASAQNNIGLLYLDIDNYKKADVQFRKALGGFQKNNDSIGIAATLSNLGALNSKMRKYDSAFYYHEKAVTLNRLTGNQYGLCVGLQEFAKTCMGSGQINKAIENYEKSRQIAIQINQPFYLATAFIGLGNAHLKLNRFAEALQNADNAMLIAINIDNINIKQSANELYSEIYEQKGDTDNAFLNYRNSVVLKDSLMNQTKLHQIYNLEIEHLSLAGEIQKLEIQRQELLISKKNNIIYFIGLLFFLTLISIYLIYLNINHRRQAAIQQTILSLTEKKSRAAVEAEMQERKRIGQELHDGLGQILTVAKLNISALQQKISLSEERRIELLDAAIHSVDEAFEELRNISHNLAPSVVTDKGLAGALEDLKTQVNQSKKLVMQLEMYGLNNLDDKLIENTLYRSVQEILNNALKHSEADHFFLQVIKSEYEITLMFEDNGNGFDLNSTLIHPGSGLNNLRSRIENLRGSIYIDSMKGRGTIVTIMLPIKKSENVHKTHPDHDHR